MMRTLILALAAATGVSCTATQTKTVVNAPFRAGVLPVESSLNEQPATEGDATSLELSLDEVKLTTDLVTALDSSIFTHAELIELGESADETAYIEAVIAAAEAADLDVVLRPSLSYSTDVRTGANEKLWLNLPLFFIGGPLNWFPNDRSYFVDAELRFNVLDVEYLRQNRGGRATDALLISGEGSTNEIELDLFDRAGNGVGYYALGIVLPGVLLAKETDRAASAVAQAVGRSLTEDALNELRGDVNELVRGESVYKFYPSLELAPDGDGYRLQGHVAVIGVDAQLDSMEVLCAGQDVIDPYYFEEDVEFDPQSSFSTALRRYPIQPVAVSAEQARAGLRVTLRDSQLAGRTFTYAIR